MNRQLNWIHKVRETPLYFIVDDKFYIPKSEGNSHYQMVRQWLNQGNRPEESRTEIKPNEVRLQQALSKRNEMRKQGSKPSSNDKGKAWAHGIERAQ